MALKRWGRAVRVDVNLEGISELFAQLGDLEGKSNQVLSGLINRTVIETQREAKIGIQRGPKTGRVYKRRSVSHQASAPGEYPATDAGRLASSVWMNLSTPQHLEGSVGTNILYGPHLEFGTSRMAARPWLMPSLEKARAKVEGSLRSRLERLL